MASTRWDANAVLKDLTIIAEDTLNVTRPDLYPLICATKDADGAYTKIPIADNIAMPKLFEGERDTKGKDVTVVQNYNQGTYELTVELDADLLADGKAYDQSDIVREAAMSFVQFPDYLTSQLVINGGTNNAYDGNAFYGATHTFAKVAGNNIDNTVARTGGTVTHLGNDLSSAIAKLKTFKDSKGRLLNQQAKMSASDLLIQAPAALENNFRQLLNSSWVPIATPVTTSGTAAASVGNNNWQGQADLYIDGYLDGNSPTAWYVHYISRPQRPFVMLEDYPTQMKVLGLDSEHCTKTNKVMIAFKRRFVLGYYRFDRSLKVA